MSSISDIRFENEMCRQAMEKERRKDKPGPTDLEKRQRARDLSVAIQMHINDCSSSDSVTDSMVLLIRHHCEKYLKDSEDGYDPDFGDDRLCQCGHPYYRHFDTYDDMADVGCKYCHWGECEGFVEGPYIRKDPPTIELGEDGVIPQDKYDELYEQMPRPCQCHVDSYLGMDESTLGWTKEKGWFIHSVGYNFSAGRSRYEYDRWSEKKQIEKALPYDQREGASDV